MLRGSQLCLHFCWSDMRTCMLELKRVSSPSIFSVPCRLQLKVLCIFNQGNTVFEVLIRKIIGQSSVIMCSDTRNSSLEPRYSILDSFEDRGTSFELRLSTYICTVLYTCTYYSVLVKLTDWPNYFFHSIDKTK